MIKLKNIEDVVNYQLCTGCGMCEAVEPERFRMDDVESYGVRPKVIDSSVAESGEAFKVCPGHSLEHNYDTSNPGLLKKLEDCWGPVLGVWEGYAADDAIRFKASSGGAATALSLFGVEKKNANNVVQIGANKSSPVFNETKLSKTKEELLENTGSRYSPASPCNKIGTVQNDVESTVFVGKPCDVAAVKKWETAFGEGKEFLVKIGFFCAGTPSTKGNKSLIQKASEDRAAKVESLKFRGEGWPGMWKATYEDELNQPGESSMTYGESWGYLQKFRQWRCYICPDHTSEFADIAVGDPWYREVVSGEPGKSLIVARTEKGLRYLQEAVDAKYIVLENSNPEILPNSQRNLIRARGELWGRMLILKLFGVPIPKYAGFKLFPFWIKLSSKYKIQSIYGTIKRIKVKSLKISQKIIP